MAYTAGFSVNVGDPTKASDVTTLAANDDYLKAAVDGKAALSGSTNNTVATVTGANALIGEADLTFASNKLTVFGTTGTGTATAGVLNLSTRETTVVDADQLGRIDFQAPAETGADAILVTASIYAEADVTFDATNNATDIVFATAHDGAAAERLRITSQGEIGLAGANYGTDGQVLTSAGAGAAVAWETIPPGTTLSGSTDNTIATVTGANALQGEADLTFASNKLTVFGTTGTGTAPPAVINLSTRETTVVEDDQLGRIDFQAPFEIDSPDARLVAASIFAVADNTFASGINTTDLVFATANSEAATEKMRVGAAGYIGMGISSPQTYISVPGLVVGGTSANSEICLVSGTSNSALLGFTDTADSTNQGMIAYEHGSVNAMKFFTNGENERFRIDSAGNVGVGMTPSYPLDTLGDQNGGWGARLGNSGSSTPYGLWIRFTAAAPNNTAQKFIDCVDSTSNKFIVWSNGTCQNATGTFSTISDIKLKQDIIDVRSYWDDFKAVRFRKFRFKEDVEANADASSMFGVVAQELETVFPDLVYSSPDTENRDVPVLDEDGNPTYTIDDDGNEVAITKEEIIDLGTSTKSVKSSILGQIGLKVVQELQTRLEAAEAKIAALESA